MDRELDPDICGWIIEFLVFKSKDEMLVKKLIQALPFNLNLRMKKAILLRSIKNEIESGEVSEKLLDYLEMIERIDGNQMVPHSMKEAFCAVALECTVKYLNGDRNPNDQYSAAVERIWRGRIENLEKSKASNLVSESELLTRYRRLVEAAFGNEVIIGLIAINTQAKAITSLKIYLREALTSMGKPFLERVCSEPRALQVVFARGAGEGLSSS